MLGLRGAVGRAMVVTMLSASVAVPAHAKDDDAKRAAARALATEGARAIEQGHWAEGIDKMERAEAIVHASPHLLFIARASVKLGKLVQAHEAYVKILREELPARAPKAFVEARRAAAAEQAALEPRLAKLTIVLKGASAKEVGVTIDGNAVVPALVGVAQPADPGAHVLRASGAGWNEGEASVTLAEGANETVTLIVTRRESAAPGATALDAAPLQSSDRAPRRTTKLTPLSLAAFGVGVVGLAAGTFFLLQNRGHREDANALCGPGPCPSEKRGEIEALDAKADDAAVFSWIGYGVGAAGIVAGASLLLLRRTSSSPPPTTGGVTPWVGLAAAGLEGRF